MENYKIILDALAEKIVKLERENCVKDIQIDGLKKKLAEAEQHLVPSPVKAKKLEIRKEG